MRKLKLALALLGFFMATTVSVYATAVSYDELEYRSVTKDGKTMPYRLFVPPTYDASAKYPIWIFLHGMGETGTDNEDQLKNQGQGSMYFIDTVNQQQYPMFYMAPQSGGGWNEGHLACLKQAIADLSAEFNIDMDRIYLTGISMGGAGCWNFLSWAPDYFACGVPMSFGSGQSDKLVGQPIWTFHAANDGTVGVGGTDGIVKTIRNLGGSVIYTRYDYGGHGIWSTAYHSPLLLPWVMSQRRGQPSTAAPLVSVTSPNGTTSTSELLNASGAVSFAGYDLSSVTWTNSRGGNGTATGTTDWSISNVQLYRAEGNQFNFLATGTSWSTSLAGNTTFNVSKTMTFRPSQDKKVTIEVFKGIDGSTVADVIAAPNFPDSPDVVHEWPNTNAYRFGGLNFGQRMYTLVKPSTTGDYKFYVASDKNAVVYLSSNDNPDNKVQICEHSGYLPDRYTYDRYDAQQSAPVHLVAGQKYYLEVIHKHQWGSDHMSVAWSGPGIGIQVIPSANLELYTGSSTEPTNVAPTVDAGSNATITLPATASLNGTVSDDGLPTGTTVTSTWTKESGPGTVTFGNASAIDTTASFSVDGTYVLKLTASDTELTTSDTVTITVNPEPVPTYTLTVNSGSGDGDYEEGDAVTITADAAPTGQEFVAWTGDVQYLADANAAQTTITVPAANVSVTATYQDIVVFYTVTVNSGSGDGEYEAGDTVTVAADTAPVGQEFAAWAGDVQYLADADAAQTTLTVPAANVSITATYQDIVPENEAPVVNAGTDLTITLLAAATLTGTASDDGYPDGTLTVAWSKQSGPGSVTFANAGQTNTTATFSEVGSYVLKLTADDGSLSSSDTVTITVEAEPDPYGDDPGSIPQDGLVLYLPFNEGTGTIALDQSDNHLDGTLLNGTTWVDGHDGNGVDFDRTDDRVLVPYGDAMAMDNAITIAFWFKADAWDGTFQSFISRANWMVECRPYGTPVLNFRLDWDGSYAGNVTCPVPTAGEWHHFAGTYDGQFMRIYLDGEQVAEKAETRTFRKYSADLSIGSRGTNSLYGGAMDEVAIYNRGLSAAEVTELMNGSTETAPVAPEEGQILHLDFDEGSGDLATDSSGSALNGDLLNGATWEEGVSGTALSLDGSDDRVVVPYGDVFALDNAITIAFWFKADTWSGTFQTLASRANWMVESRPYGTPVLNFRLDWGGDYAGNVTCPIPTAGEWHHFAGTYDGQNMRIYIDGAMVAEQAETRTFRKYTSDLSIGARGTSNPYGGNIDDFYIYNRGLSAAEVEQVMSSGQ